jgi:chromate reductase
VVILGISGSVRRGSFNTRLLEAAAELLPESVELVLWDGLKDVPPFDQDEELGPAPEPVARLRELIETADAVLFATPEYNSSVPGQLKNALDWISRPHATSPLRNKPVAVIGTSTGAFGALSAQADLRRILARIGARVVEEGVAVGRAESAFDVDGRLVDPRALGHLRGALGALAAGASAWELAAA